LARYPMTLPFGTALLQWVTGCKLPLSPKALLKDSRIYDKSL
jgi:hypothetical protein